MLLIRLYQEQTFGHSVQVLFEIWEKQGLVKHNRVN